MAGTPGGGAYRYMHNMGCILQGCVATSTYGYMSAGGLPSGAAYICSVSVFLVTGSALRGVLCAAR
jgi:hypothetical protein